MEHQVKDVKESSVFEYIIGIYWWEGCVLQAHSPFPWNLFIHATTSKCKKIEVDSSVPGKDHTTQNCMFTMKPPKP